jgi:hypothetical protein
MIPWGIQVMLILFGGLGSFLIGHLVGNRGAYKQGFDDGMRIGRITKVTKEK